MPNPENVEPYKFKKGESGNPAGRPKKIENVIKEHFLAEHNLKLTKSQAQDIIKTILGKTRTELIELAKNDELPFWVALIANKAQRDFKKGSIHILDVLFDRVYGKPKEEIDQTVNGGKPETIEVVIHKPDEN
jgi:hypothetical protein|tara:strand:+ start:180 stop:578 length:399 start_codon:yes stop_codon:yes gene_type:complete